MTNPTIREQCKAALIGAMAPYRDGGTFLDGAYMAGVDAVLSTVEKNKPVNKWGGDWND